MNTRQCHPDRCPKKHILIQTTSQRPLSLSKKHSRQTASEAAELHDQRNNRQYRKCYQHSAVRIPSRRWRRSHAQCHRNYNWQYTPYPLRRGETRISNPISMAKQSQLFKHRIQRLKLAFESVHPQCESIIGLIPSCYIGQCKGYSGIHA